jgi:hypothetical protein
MPSRVPALGRSPAIVTLTRRKRLKLVRAELAASGDREVRPEVKALLAPYDLARRCATARHL